MTAAEEQLARERSVVEDPAVATDAVRLQEALQAMEQAPSLARRPIRKMG